MRPHCGAGSGARAIHGPPLLRGAERRDHVRQDAVAQLADEATPTSPSKPAGWSVTSERRTMGQLRNEFQSTGDPPEADPAENLAPEKHVRGQIAPDAEEGARAAADAVRLQAEDGAGGD